MVLKSQAFEIPGPGAYIGFTAVNTDTGNGALVSLDISIGLELLSAYTHVAAAANPPTDASTDVIDCAAASAFPRQSLSASCA